MVHIPTGQVDKKTFLEKGSLSCILVVIALCILMPGTALAASANTPRLAPSVGITVTVHNSLTDAPWWSGKDCDTNAHSGSYALGQVMDTTSPAYGLLACGPRPDADKAADVPVAFNPALGSPAKTWGVNEWECVEISMRYMYLAWGVNPYPANGNTVASGYQANKSQFNPNGPNLQLITYRPGIDHVMPQAGDVLSTDDPNPAGHTAVIISSQIDANGTGNIKLIQQNWADLTAIVGTYHVTNWNFDKYYSSYAKSWLHNPNPSGNPGPPAINAPSGTSTCTVLHGTFLDENCDAPQVTINCGGPIPSQNDNSGVPITWTNTNGSKPCDIVLYTFSYGDGRTNCSFYFYVPNGFGATKIYATLSDGSQQLIDEAPVSGWQYWFAATDITSLTFNDGNGTSKQQLGWGSGIGQSIERLCSL